MTENTDLVKEFSNPAAALSEGWEIKISRLPSVMRSSGHINRELIRKTESVGKQTAATTTLQLLGGRGESSTAVAALSEAVADGSLIIPAPSQSLCQTAV